MNKAIQKIRDYEDEGYRYELMDVEESQYTDIETMESGDRVVIQVAMKRVNKRGIKGGKNELSCII
jgi:methyl coenzyme M reductase beta subunit